MSYSIDVETCTGYLKITVRGEQTFQSNQRLIEAIVATCVEHGVSRVLVDIRGYTGQPGTVWDYELAKFASERSLQVVTRTAVLTTRENEGFTSFFETAARNQGLSLRSFVDPGEAAMWIAGNCTPSDGRPQS